MKPESIFLLSLILLAGCTFQGGKEITPGSLLQSKPCKNIKPGIELTFEVSYCQGDMCQVNCDLDGSNCHTVVSKEECETIDVVDDTIAARRDGKPDCEWKEDICRPNK